MAREEVQDKNRYYSIIGGSFRTQVPEDHPEAIKREWQKGDESGVKWERHVKALIGFIEDIQFRDTEYGMQVYIALDANENGDVPVISLNAKSREAEDFLKKLPNINLMKEVRLRPFNFEGDRGDEVRGMEILQEDEFGEFSVKITNYFRDSEAKTNVNGFPNPEGDTKEYSKDDWKIYFLQANKWLVNFTKEKMQAKVAQAVIDRGTAVPQSAEQEARMREVLEPAKKQERPSFMQRDPETGEVEPNPDDVPF